MKFSFLVFLFAVIANPVVALQLDQQQLRFWLEKHAGRSFSDYEARQRISAYLSGTHEPALRSPYTGKPAMQPVSFRGNQAASARPMQGAKILAILIDFPDLPYDDNRLKQGDSDMYYLQYPSSHYQQLIFSEQGFDAPDGEILNSANQYYLQASGGSFALSGEVFGWITAEQNASYYGQRIGARRDSKVADLVKEAVDLAVKRYAIDLSDYDLTDLNDRDGDGVLNEPDGVVDHIMLFHSSIGEEAGGGVLGTDAIWSHRFVVAEDGYTPVALANSDIRIHNYTINPLDASMGVVAHEFGHELGLIDEYDLNNGTIGEPVANWSVMSSGNWLGSLRGSQPVSFSPRNLVKLQNQFGGNWVKQVQIDLTQLRQGYQASLSRAGEHTGQTDQLKVILPSSLEYVGEPISGQYQYYSGHGNGKQNQASMTLTLPESEALILTMRARFDIERGYDFFQVKVNQQPLAGNETKPQHPLYPAVTHYVDGHSGQATGGSNGSLVTELRYSLTAFAGETITLEFLYQTDSLEYGFGILLDDIAISDGENIVAIADAELAEQLSLSGFDRISRYREGLEQAYYLQLRSHHGIDAGLQGASYMPGVLVWYANENIDDNSTSLHPGEGKILVVDTDQGIIPRTTSETPAATRIQLRDAALRLEDQNPGLGDTQLQAVYEFSDAQDYSHPQQPVSGVVLPQHGVTIELLKITEQYRQAQLQLTASPKAKIRAAVDGLTVSFSVSGLTLNTSDTFEWQFGDGNRSELLAPSHQYNSRGTYTVTFTRKNSAGETQSVEQQFTLAAPLKLLDTSIKGEDGNIIASVQYQGGAAPVTVRWKMGDGTELEGAKVQHQYNLSGFYQIVVSLEDASGSKVSDTFERSVTVPLSGEITASQSGLTANLSLSMRGGSGNYAVSWAFGDGQSANGESVSHTYQGAGPYQVTATMSDLNDNQQVTVIKDISVSETASSGQEGSAGSLFGLSILLMMLIRIRKRPA
ncbi:immune inhibitor A domain-containing protein [Pseudoalteromonas sp. OOF1S-7]|uniref:immune inhibitor A domain-containing protein n=1 Tax=Pseudoalteromonas sp. OOF1S-7 TaxID=2917757 RepID=UPI001EF655AE|nr:immune inhibitor A domain-containing protein [Pseudoalteromonas sp. OOF1S-7]MCG7533970.1 immune inhibitor A [Pseudoalteromonas sp. OOF1S-7]